MTSTVPKTQINEVKNKIPNFSGSVKKHIMMIKYQKSRENTLLLLIITSLRKRYLMQG